MDVIKLKIKEQDDKLAALQKIEDAWADFEKDQRERVAKPEEFKDIVAPTAPKESQDEIRNKKEAANEIKAQLDAQLDKLVSDSMEVNLPPALKEDKRDNIILLGPAGCGKTTACNFLSQE
jgi:flagellar biosynthesis GTPase FlhF